MNPRESGWNVTSLETPGVQLSLRLKLRTRSQDSAPYRGWCSLTARGTRPTRLARMSVCKVIRPLEQMYIGCVTTTLGSDMLSDFSLDLLQVELKMRKTCFWRHQKGKPDSYLATIEAIYYFLRDYHKYCLGQEYDGEYDNLLFFYSFLHSIVNKAKTERKTWNQFGKTVFSNPPTTGVGSSITRWTAPTSTHAVYRLTLD